MIKITIEKENGEKQECECEEYWLFAGGMPGAKESLRIIGNATEKFRDIVQAEATISNILARLRKRLL